MCIKNLGSPPKEMSFETFWETFQSLFLEVLQFDRKEFEQAQAGKEKNWEEDLFLKSKHGESDSKGELISWTIQRIVQKGHTLQELKAFAKSPEVIGKLVEDYEHHIYEGVQDKAIDQQQEKRSEEKQAKDAAGVGRPNMLRRASTLSSLTRDSTKMSTTASNNTSNPRKSSLLQMV